MTSHPILFSLGRGNYPLSIVHCPLLNHITEQVKRKKKAQELLDKITSSDIDLDALEEFLIEEPQLAKG